MEAPVDNASYRLWLLVTNLLVVILSVFPSLFPACLRCTSLLVASLSQYNSEFDISPQLLFLFIGSVFKVPILNLEKELHTPTRHLKNSQAELLLFSLVSLMLLPYKSFCYLSTFI